MAEVSHGRSYFAMLLSLIIPGTGQLYLRKPWKGLLLFLGVAAAGAIFYINSMPVESWQDLKEFKGMKEWWAARRGMITDSDPTSKDQNSSKVTEKEQPHYHLLTFEDGR